MSIEKSILVTDILQRLCVLYVYVLYVCVLCQCLFTFLASAVDNNFKKKLTKYAFVIFLQNGAVLCMLIYVSLCRLFCVIAFLFNYGYHNV